MLLYFRGDVGLAQKGFASHSFSSDRWATQEYIQLGLVQSQAFQREAVPGVKSSRLMRFLNELVVL